MILNLLLLLTLLLLSLGQLGRISFFGQQVNFYLYEPFLIMGFLLLLFRYRLQPFISLQKLSKPLMVFIAVLIVSFLLSTIRFSTFENYVALLYFVRLVFYLLVFFSIFHHCRKDKNYQRLIQNGVILFSAVTILFSLVQYFLYPDLRNLYYEGWDPHLYRLVGLFFDPPISGAIFGLLFFYFLLQPFQNKVIKWSGILIFGLFILLTYSRSTYIASLIILTVILLRKKLVYFIPILCIAFVIGLYLLPKQMGEGVNLFRSSTISSRSIDYQQALQIFKKYPVLGIGYDHIRYEKKKENIIGEKDFEITHSGASFHSSFLIILVCGGLIGLAAYLWFLYSIMKLSYLAVIVVGFLSLLSLTDNVLLHPFILFLSFLLISSERS